MNILVVDDVQTDREITGQVVKSAGHHVAYAESGAEAVAKAKASPPDLILMDVVMNGQNGFEATRELKRTPATAKIPIVLVTTKGTESDRFWGKRQGADDHVVKPFSAEALLEVIARFGR